MGLNRINALQRRRKTAKASRLPKKAPPPRWDGTAAGMRKSLTPANMAQQPPEGND
jgi:hypothetical protein